MKHIIFVLALLFLLSGCVIQEETLSLDPPQPKSKQPQETFDCTDKQREAKSCIEIHEPVCGWFDAEKIKCVTHPCAQTFTNTCFACKDPNVLYWTPHECPEK